MPKKTRFDKLPKKKIVCIEWEDASSNNGYYDSEHPEKTATINAQTVGFLLNKNKKEVTLGVERFQDGDYRHIHSIPHGMVRKMTVLSEAK